MAQHFQQTITLKTVLHSIQEAGTEFSIKFRKLNGKASFKARVKKNPSAVKSASTPAAKDLGGIRRNMTGAGALLLWDCDNGHTFEVKIELITHFNGMRIFHNY